MAAKYKKLIEDYCAKHGIAVPPGFARNTPGRYAIVRTNLNPPKLIATTWSKTADVLYYIENFIQPELGAAMAQSIRIFNFQESEELAYASGKQFDKIGTL